MNRRTFRSQFSEPAVVSSETMTVATTVAIPILPSSIRIIMIFRRTGWFMISSDSVVVNPTPEKAERAWKRAASWDKPVNVKAIAAILVTRRDRIATVNREKIATI